MFSPTTDVLSTWTGSSTRSSPATRVFGSRWNTPAKSQRVWGNVTFAARAIEGGAQRANFIGGYLDASRALVRPFGELFQRDLSLLPSEQSLISRPARELASYPEADRDFEGRRRTGSLPGAYGGGPRVSQLDLVRRPMRGRADRPVSEVGRA